MEAAQEPVSRRDFIRDKHRSIYLKYLELMRRESAENPLRAEHIGKLYYARIIARSLTPAMNPDYVIRIINNQLRKTDDRDYDDR